MPTLFTRILDGELPGRFVHRDAECAAFLTIAPLRPGHVLVVPVREVDSWLDLPPELAAHLMTVAQRVGRAVREAFGAERAGLVVAGLEVPHTHLHVLPLDAMSDLDFTRVDTAPDPADLDDAQRRILALLGPLPGAP